MRRTPLIVAVCLHAAHAAWSDVPDWLLTNASDWHTPTLRDGPCGAAVLGGAPKTRCLAFSNGLLTQIFALPDDGGFGTVALTGEPSLAPTYSPTFMPTFAPCTKDLADYNNCDTDSARCAIIAADDGSVSGTFCQCLEGFVSDPTDPYRCLATLMPTHQPTHDPTPFPTGFPTSPTISPTPQPTHSPTSRPTKAPTFPDKSAMCDLCGKHSCSKRS